MHVNTFCMPFIDCERAAEVPLDVMITLRDHAQTLYSVTPLFFNFSSCGACPFTPSGMRASRTRALKSWLEPNTDMVSGVCEL